MTPLWPFKAKKQEPQREFWEAYIPTDEHRGLQVVTVDEAHLTAERDDKSAPPPYELAACEALILDATGYNFRFAPEAPEARNNMVQLVGDGAIHGLVWIPGLTTYVLSRDTLQSLGGASPFDGFKPGQKVVLAIGLAVRPQQNPSAMAFYPSWYGVMLFK